MRKLSLPAGMRCRRILISATPGDIARWDRRAAEERKHGRTVYASRSGAIRADANAARRLRHDLRSPLNTLAILEHELRRGVVDGVAAAETLKQAAARILHLIQEES